MHSRIAAKVDRTKMKPSATPNHYGFSPSMPMLPSIK
jgi:hypothetical protein